MSIRVAGTPKTLEASGASITTGNVAQADNANYAVGAAPSTGDGLGAAHVEFTLSCAFGTGPTENTTVDLYLQPLNIDGTSDSEPPENTTGFKGEWYVGSFILNNVTTTQYHHLIVENVPAEFAAWLHNNGGQTLSSGWKLVATPRALKASA